MKPTNKESFKLHLGSLFDHLKKELQLKTTPKIFLVSDQKNADKILGKTAHYEPETKTIKLNITDRHPKDILRSFSHEVIHHWQHENEKLNAHQGENDPKYAQNNPWLRQMEKQAYLLGNMLFRDWEDKKKADDKKSGKKVNEGLGDWFKKFNKGVDKVGSWMDKHIDQIPEPKKPIDPEKFFGKTPPGGHPPQVIWNPGKGMDTSEKPKDTGKFKVQGSKIKDLPVAWDIKAADKLKKPAPPTTPPPPEKSDEPEKPRETGPEYHKKTGKWIKDPTAPYLPPDQKLDKWSVNEVEGDPGVMPGETDPRAFVRQRPKEVKPLPGQKKGGSND